jgi:hypothetical protein
MFTSDRINISYGRNSAGNLAGLKLGKGDWR